MDILLLDFKFIIVYTRGALYVAYLGADGNIVCNSKDSNVIHVTRPDRRRRITSIYMQIHMACNYAMRRL